VLVVEDELLLRMMAVEVVSKPASWRSRPETRMKRLPCWNPDRTFLCYSPTSTCPEAWTG
jgi:hypothetical protein